MSRHPSGRAVAGVLLALSLSLSLAPALGSSSWAVAGAQTSTARISGTVTGEGGAPVPDVTIAARSLSTNTTRSARSSTCSTSATSPATT